MGELLGITLRHHERVALVAMLLASDGAHLTLWHGQTVALCLVFAALALTMRARHPWIAALALALSSFKPHVAVGIGMVLLLERRAVLVIRALAVTIILSWLFGASVGRSLFGILTDYASNLQLLYLGTNRVRGMLSVWFAIEDFTTSYTWATVIYVSLAVMSLAMLLRWSWRRRHDAAGRALAAGSTILWSLLFFPHQRYDVLLAAPALWLLMWPEAGVFRRESTRVAVVAGYVIFSTMDVPVLMRVIAEPEAPLYWQSYALTPLSVALLLGITMTALARTASTDTA